MSHGRFGDAGIREGTAALRQRATAVMLASAIVVVAARRAFACDDAYITFRTVDNVIHGYGLTWNTAERVQAYTNPLWALVMSLFATATREAYYTSLFLQLAFTGAAAYLLATRVARGVFGAIACLLPLVLSKAFIDYSTSGLENALGHFTLVAFAIAFLRNDGSLHGLQRLALFAGFAVLNRLDYGILVAPAIGISAYATLRRHGFRPTFRSLVLGGTPCLVWNAFALFYYGTMLPNSARSKLSAGVHALDLVTHGLLYLSNSIRYDPLTLLAIATTAAVAVASRQLLPLACGMLLYLTYVVRVGGDFMSGRFLTPPIVMAAVLVARLDVLQIRSVRIAFLSVLAIAAFALEFPSLSFVYTNIVGAETDENFIGDYARAWHATSGFMTRAWAHRQPEHEWATYGKNLKKENARDKVSVLGGIGFAGYYAGPKITIIDKYALADPLLSRLPVPDAVHEQNWNIGHWERLIPRGYRESVAHATNEIESPSLAAYYEKIRIVTRGSLWSPKRLWVIVTLNLGFYDHYLREYLEDYNAKPVDANSLAPASTAIPSRESTCEGSTYTWYSPCATSAVFFSNVGAMVRLPKPSQASRIEIELTPGDYDVAFWTKSRVCGRMAIHADGKRQPIPVPEAATQAGFDAVSIRFSRDEKRELTYFAVVP